MADHEHSAAPPVGEEIHMPAPSLLPVLNAAGLAVAIIGIPVSLTVVIAGMVLFLWTTVVWIGKARQEFQELPAEHGHH